jgi:N-methylhydantoinase B
MTGGAYTNCTFVPPRGVAGGYPGSAGTAEILRETNLLDLFEHGTYPTEQAVQGHPEGGPAQTASLIFHRGDVYTVTHGGGGGVGDPLLRDVDDVCKDITDGYISAESARGVYGVELDGDGNVDARATEQLGADIRQARIGHAPERAIRADSTPFAPVRIVAGRWTCGLCGEDLGDAAQNWRTAAVVSEREISERFAELHLSVRRREQFEPVVLRENFCPGCASSLAVDVTLAGHPPAPAPRPGVIDPYPADQESAAHTA